MRVLVIGALGQLGTDICATLAGEDIYKADLDGDTIALDICNADAVKKCVAELCPDIVINTAAEHEVEECEAHPDRAFSVNAIGAFYVAKACDIVKARLVHISTDYVFGGTPPEPLRPYTELDTPAPLNVYGASKRAGEHLVAAACHDHIIVRTAALYGLSPCRGKGGRNFVEMMLSLAASGRDIKVVTDIYTSPTCTIALARQLRLLAEKGTPGIYHAACAGSARGTNSPRQSLKKWE
jgi:dTDP-4-dehydrorhamnose reductase